MADCRTIEQLQAAIEAAVLALDPTLYALVGSDWALTPRYLDALGDAQRLGDLLVDVVIVRGSLVEQLQTIAGPVDAVTLEILATMTTRIRTGSETADYARTQRAAAALARAILTVDSRWSVEGSPRPRRATEGAEVGASPGVEGWLVTTVEVRGPALIPHVADPVAPAFVTPPAIVGTFDEGEVLTAIPGVVTGTGPISRVYRWIWQGGPAATYGATAQVPAGATSVVVEETATGAVAPPAVAASQSLGAGGGPVDCEVTCAATIAAAEAAAAAAERARALDWLYLGKAGVVSLTFSDPASLLSASSLDSATGIFAVTADPGVQTATPTTFAGWEGRIYGPVDGVDFATTGQMIVARLIRDLAVTQTTESDLEAIVLFANGPRATATIGFGGGFRATSSGDVNRRAVNYILRTTWTRNTGSAALIPPAVQITGPAGGTAFNGATRLVSASGALSSTSAAGTAGSSGNALAPTEWPEAWVSILFGRIVGDGIAPNNAAESARVMPVFTYTAPDWTLVGIPP